MTLCRTLCSAWRRIRDNIVYQAAALFLPQDGLALFASSKGDKFSNITALTEKLDSLSMPFVLMAQNDFQTRPFRSLVVLARARVVVLDAASPFARIRPSQNTVLIHCWHACGAYKKVAFDAKRKDFDEKSEEKRIQRIHRGISWFVCTSEETARIYAGAFRLPLERMLVFGSPRMDAVLQAAHSPEPSEYTVLFAPTYRTFGQKTRYLPPMPDDRALRQVLESELGEKVRLAFRSHPSLSVSNIPEGWEDWSALPQEEALRRTSVLVTDYSSIFFDFLPFKRPIVFYVPDYEVYQRHERELYFSPYDAFPKTTCSDEGTLSEILVQCRHEKAGYGEVWQKHMSACDGRASERLCHFIQQIMKRNKK